METTTISLNKQLMEQASIYAKQLMMVMGYLFKKNGRNPV